MTQLTISKGRHRVRTLTAAVLGVLGFLASMAAEASVRDDVLLKLRDDGLMVADINGYRMAMTITGGVVSLQTDDIHCVATPTHICSYTLNVVKALISNFTWDSKGFNDGFIVINGPIAVQDSGSGIIIPKDTPAVFAFTLIKDGHAPQRSSVEGKVPDVVNLQSIDLSAQHLAMHGGFKGPWDDGVTVDASLAVNAISPFVNLPPKADAGPDQTVNCGQRVHLDGSGSSDPNNDISVYAWSENGVTFALGSQVDYPMTTGTHTVTLTVSDSFGGRSADTLTVEVTANSAKPVFTSVPGPVTITSCSNPDIGTAEATDACGEKVTIDHSPKTFLPGTTTVTWTATNASGKTNTATQVVKTAKPVFSSVPGPATIRTCNNPDIGTANATDVCGNTLTVDHSPKTFAPGTTTVTWTATDASGNSAEATQLVTTDKPVFTSIPGPATINSCNDPDIGTAKASDVCGNSLTADHTPKNFSIGTTTVTWTATDSAGNSATATQSVVTGPPRFVQKPAPVTFTECDSQAEGIGQATAVDACGADLVVTNNPKGPFPVGTTTVIWTAKDAAGSASTYEQKVTVSPGIELGAEHYVSSVKNNACLKVTKYPNWGQYMHTLIVQPQAGGVGWPIPFTYSNCSSNRGSSTLPGPWLQGSTNPVSATCPTLIKLGGGGTGSISLTWWGNG
jgi:hypothetical protein